MSHRPLNCSSPAQAEAVSNRESKKREHIDFCSLYHRDAVELTSYTEVWMSRRWFPLVIVLLYGSASAGELTLTQKQLNIESFEKVSTRVRDTYWDPKLGGVDWQAAHDEFRPAVERAVTMTEARSAMTGMLAKLHQTHFGILPGDVYSDVDDKAAASEGNPGIEVRVENGQALVTSVESSSPASKAGV